MKIINTPIDQVIPYARNPRKNDGAVDKVAASIQEFGFRQPIVVYKDMVVIVGHTRLLAAKKLGLAEVPVLIADNLTPNQVKAYRLADNRTNEEAEWDREMLGLELLDLQNEEFELELTGFDEDELHALLNPPEETAGLTDEDAVPDVVGDPISREGDIFVLGNHRLMCGDSTNPLHVESLTQDAKPALMVTDPPYGVVYDPEWRDRSDLGVGERSKGKVMNDDRADWTDAYSLFTGDVAYIWHASLHSAVVFNNLKDCGFEMVSQIIWAKQHFALSRGDYHWQHEPCWYAVRKGKKHNWQGARDQATVWSIKNNNAFGNSEKEKTWGHGTQKPVECMLKPIVNNSRVNDHVYDPFGGSGTTLIACDKETRKCLMMELDPKYCDVIIKRWQEFSGKKAVLESTGEEFGAIDPRGT